jgi:hypothetical protein
MHHTVLVDYELAVAQQGFIVRALLELEGKAPTASNRIPLNLSVVLDRSGSMAGDKLAAARDAAAMLVQRLHPDDTARGTPHPVGTDGHGGDPAGAGGDAHGDPASVPFRLVA